MRILLVEDDQRIANPIEAELEYQRYVVDRAVDGQAALEMARGHEYDLILLDLLLPKLDGITVCHELRKMNYAGPILVMTARSSTQDKVLGLDSGADDYLVKPFDLEELSARVRALLRRGSSDRQSLLHWQDLIIDPGKCTAEYKGNPIPLTPTEYRLLTFFLRHPNRTFSAEALWQRLWLADENPTRDVIKTHMKGLRKKLREAGITQEVIETVYGFGYRLKSGG